MAGFARFLGDWSRVGHVIEPDETVSNVCYIYSSFIPALLITAYIARHRGG
jgi:hypothetical protein